MLASDRPADILVVEDNDDYAWLIEQELREAGVANRIYRACDGLAALEFMVRVRITTIMVFPARH